MYFLTYFIKSNKLNKSQTANRKVIHFTDLIMFISISA